jgi:hypothetical protein
MILSGYIAAAHEPDMKNHGEGSVLIMTNRLENPPARRLACSLCGTEFSCNPAGRAGARRKP